MTYLCIAASLKNGKLFIAQNIFNFFKSCRLCFRRYKFNAFPMQIIYRAVCIENKCFTNKNFINAIADKR